MQSSTYILTPFLTDIGILLHYKPKQQDISSCPGLREADNNEPLLLDFWTNYENNFTFSDS